MVPDSHARWTRITEGVDAFRGRQVRGKVVLDVDQT
jgi:hypothetical protein